MDISNLSIATIRSLGIDTINKANSGHPGMALGSAPALYTLFNKELNIYNKEENKINYYLFIVPIVILVLLIALIRRRKKYER